MKTMRKPIAMLRSLCLVLSLLLMMTAFASCGDKGNDENVQVTTAAETAAEKELTPIDSLGALKELDLGGRTIRIDISAETAGEWTTSAVYVMGETEESGDAIKDQVYRRNRDVCETLNVNVAWTTSDLSYDKVEQYLMKNILAGDDSTDLHINDQFGLIRVMQAGGLINLDDDSMYAGENYFDFTTEGWHSDYMEGLSVIGGRYMLVGDYFMDTMRATHVIYFNRSHMDNYLDGSDTLYDTVAEGDWTYDEYTRYANEFYHDINGNGEADDEDLFAVRGHVLWAPLYFCTTDCRTVSWDEDGLPFVDVAVERLSKLVDKRIEHMNALGFRDITNDPHHNTFESFTGGRLLFTTWAKIADIERADMRNMDGIGIIPYPKLDEIQENYRSLVHDIVELGAVPVTAQPDAISAVSGYVQAMNQYSAKHIMPEYYETVLKIKYTQDNRSAQMLDIIRGGIVNPFEYAYIDQVRVLGWQALVDSSKAKENLTASTIAKGLSAAEANVAKLVETMTAMQQ